MARLFGTDGVRGIANSELGCELAYNIGKAGAKVLTSEIHNPKIIIGRDTRISGDMLCAALSAGICAAGAQAEIVGVVPTPAIAYFARTYNADAGVVISASHNSFEYNGIKWFDGEGYKLSDKLEDEIEKLINEPQIDDLPIGMNIGRIFHAQNAEPAYIEFLLGKGSELSGLKIVLDCANGAASKIAPKVFERLGAKVDTIFNMPDGCNINENCGSTKPALLQQRVIEAGADIGLAFDGDADRLIAADEFGVLVDGDRIMAICAQDMKQSGTLAKDTIVTTVMSNLGMKLHLKQQGITIVETDVGDRYVLEKMIDGGYNLGGEQSGHIIFLDCNTSGDGILSGLILCGILAKNKKKLSQLSRAIKIYPQILINIKVPGENKFLFKTDTQIIGRINQTEQEMGEKGRVLVRTSGTEPLIRVMLEGEDEKLINQEALAISRLIAEKFNGSIK